MIRMGMIGCGTMAGGYLRQMEQLQDRLRFTALVDVEGDRAERARSA
jgi:predicted dehydrogenase